MKKIKKLTIILIIVLLCLVSFIGIYIKNHALMKNIIKDYDFGMNIEGYWEVRLSVATSEDEEQEITSEKVETTKKFIEKRLKQLGSEDYLIKVNYTTGEIVLEIEENDRTDRVVSDIYSGGVLKMVDSKDHSKVLITNDDIKNVSLKYSTTEQGTGVYLSLDFTKEGSKKLEDLTTNEYRTIEKEENDENAENAENTTENTDEEDAEEDAQPKVTLMIDDTEILSSSFDNPIKNGSIQLSLNQASTDMGKIQEAVNMGIAIATTLNNGPLPLEYEIDSTTYIYSEITKEVATIFIIAMAIIILIALVILVVKYKVPALLAGISYIGFIALYLIALRYTNVTITLEGVAGILIVLIVNYLLLQKLLTKTTIAAAFREMAIQSVPVIVVIVVFSFISWTNIASFGMTMFWGLLLTVIYHFIVTNALLKK